MSCVEEPSVVTVEVMNGQLVVKMRSSAENTESCCCLAPSGDSLFSKIRLLVNAAQEPEPGTAKKRRWWNIRLYVKMSFKALMGGEVALVQAGEIRLGRMERSKGRGEEWNWAANPADESNDTFSVHCRILRAEDRMYLTTEIYRVKNSNQMPRL